MQTSGQTGSIGDTGSENTAAKLQTSAGASSSEKGGSSIEKADRISSTRVEPIVITVENNLDKAMKILKRKLIKEGLFKELKTRRYFEKPSEKRKRKQKETVKKNRKEEARIKKSTLMS